MKSKFCPLTKEACREDCALYAVYDIEDCNRDYYTGCAFAVNANATVSTANGTGYIGDSLDAIESALRDMQD